MIMPTREIEFYAALYNMLEQWVCMFEGSRTMTSADKYVERVTVTKVIVELTVVNIMTVVVITIVVEISHHPPHRAVHRAVVHGLLRE